MHATPITYSADNPRRPRRGLHSAAPSRPATEFGAIERAFRSTGGLASGDEIALLLRRHCEQPLSQLARWIVSGKVIHFDLGGCAWLPIFQFDLDSMTIRPEIGALLEALGGELEPFALASWLAAPNVGLAGDAPVERIDGDLPAVLKAARSERLLCSEPT